MAIYSILSLLLVGVVVSGCGKRAKPKAAAVNNGISVQVAYAHTGSMASTVEVSGSIKALKSVQLSAKMSGRVAAVPYRENDSVGAGAVVVQQDTSDLRAQYQQAEAGLQSAKARLSQASTSAGLSDTQVEAQIAQAQAGLESARANLRMIKAGARIQELASAQNAVASAKANFENSKVNLQRMRDMFSQGAQSKQQMDLTQMQYDVAAAQYDTSKQQLSLVRAGARAEQVEAADKQVRQAEEALNIAKSNRGQKSLRFEDIKAARAGVAQAAASLTYARQQLENASIRTPIAGTVSQRLTEPGQMASPGVSLVSVVALNTVYFEATVSEMDVHKVKLGQSVQVGVDALPDRKFAGTVLKILPTANTSNRQFTVWIAISNRTGDLKPGMFARGSIEVARHQNICIIPKDALIANGDGQSVFTVLDSQAKLRTVRLGFQTRDDVEVLSGITSGDEIAVVGQDKLSDGVKVTVSR